MCALCDKIAVTLGHTNLLSNFVIILLFAIPIALCNGKLSDFVISNLSQFVIK